MQLLIAEDDITSLLILENSLRKWGFSTISAQDGTAAWDILCQCGAPKLLLLDWEMPGIDGIEICRRLRERDTANPEYIILLTANTGTDDIVTGLNAGASDYICKPSSDEELLARLRVGERTLKLQAELNETHRILSHQAMHDPLTETYNRRAIIDIVKHELARTRRTKKRLCLGMCDIDYFKNINDSYGHDVGDKVLINFTRNVFDTLRETDYVGRWGGEEFLIVAPECKDARCNGLFNRLCKKIETGPICVSNGPCPESIYITVSVGVVEGTGSESLDNLIKSADTALYKAKNNGRNKVIFVSQGRDDHE